MTSKYRINITEDGGDNGAIPLLDAFVDTLDLPALTALIYKQPWLMALLYPPTVVKRQHKKREATL